jgi:hypothetical protein
VVSEFIELRSPAGNNRVNQGIWFFWGFGFLRVFVGIWAHAMRPYGFLGGFGVFCGFLGGFGRTQFDKLTDHDAPLRVFGGVWVFEGICGDLGARSSINSLTTMRPYGFLRGFGGFQEKYVGANCDRL